MKSGHSGLWNDIEANEVVVLLASAVRGDCIIRYVFTTVQIRTIFT
jgi:hypothetical protein